MEANKKTQKNYKVKFSFLSFIIIFLLLIPLDLNRFWLRDNIPVIGGLFNFWGNVFDSVLVGLTMTFITTSLINIKFKDYKTMNLSLTVSATYINLLSSSGLGKYLSTPLIKVLSMKCQTCFPDGCFDGK